MATGVYEDWSDDRGGVHVSKWPDSLPGFQGTRVIPSKSSDRECRTTARIGDPFAMRGMSR